MRISAALACHNEEAFIQAWLEKTSAYADEILIAVHAPTDSTADIISKFKSISTVPIHCEWFPSETVARFGFSLMKNEMIAQASCDWITSIDADEEIGLTPDELRDELARATRLGKSDVRLQWAEHRDPHCRQNNSTIDYRKSHLQCEPSIQKRKVFRNHFGYWWNGLIHEEIKRQGENASRSSLTLEAKLHHHAYVNESDAEWKQPLYDYLICRIVDFPHLRAGTNAWWYDAGFKENEAAIRQNAALFLSRQHEWFPHIPSRTI